jgi:hypothetical protein
MAIIFPPVGHKDRRAVRDETANGATIVQGFLLALFNPARTQQPESVPQPFGSYLSGSRPPHEALRSLYRTARAYAVPAASETPHIVVVPLLRLRFVKSLFLIVYERSRRQVSRTNHLMTSVSLQPATPMDQKSGFGICKGVSCRNSGIESPFFLP